MGNGSCLLYKGKVLDFSHALSRLELESQSVICCLEGSSSYISLTLDVVVSGVDIEVSGQLEGLSKMEVNVKQIVILVDCRASLLKFVHVVLSGVCGDDCQSEVGVHSGNEVITIEVVGDVQSLSIVIDVVSSSFPVNKALGSSIGVSKNVKIYGLTLQISRSLEVCRGILHGDDVTVA